jgi:hypothetical protein
MSTLPLQNRIDRLIAANLSAVESLDRCDDGRQRADEQRKIYERAEVIRRLQVERRADLGEFGERRRKAQLGAIHQGAGPKGLAIAEEAYALMIRRNSRRIHTYGTDTAAELTLSEREAVLDELRTKGWQPKPGKRARDPRPSVGEDREELVGKIEALLSEKARIEGAEHVPWAYADAIARNKFGIERVRLCGPVELLGVIKALAPHVRRLAKRAAGG